MTEKLNGKNDSKNTNLAKNEDKYNCNVTGFPAFPVRKKLSSSLLARLVTKLGKESVDEDGENKESFGDFLLFDVNIVIVEYLIDDLFVVVVE